MISAILKEIELQKNYLNNEKIETIYFGGGTPSLLTASELNTIIEQISLYHDINSVKEVTVEINPDDVSYQKIKDIKSTIINRFSIGIQSFNDSDLTYLNRVHNANNARSSIQILQNAGFNNLTIDLIYGIPNSSMDIWKKNIEEAILLNIPHLSCYGLTIEEKTVFGNWLKKGKINVMDDDVVNDQFIYLMNVAEKHHFEHYEISNFAKKNSRAIHNTNYWLGKKYLGIGPSAHSYNQVNRQHNVYNNMAYCKAINENKKWFEVENLTTNNKINEYIMTSLRTIWGCDLELLKNNHQYHIMRINNDIKPLIDDDLILIKDNKLTLTQKGKLLADSISQKLFI